MLDASMSQDGFFDGMTATADGEIIDGSARLEIAGAKFPDEALVIEHDGTRPIVEVRTDIKDATDPRAKRISLAANRIAQVNLEIDPEILKELSTEIDLTMLWTPEEVGSSLRDILEKQEHPGSDQSSLLQEHFNILIECKNEQEQLVLLQRFQKEGIACRALIS